MFSEKISIETEVPSESEPTFRQKTEEGRRLEQAGDKLGAAAQYEEGRDSYSAIRLYEEAGDVTKAYELAKNSHVESTANRLADEYGIESHEFTDMPPSRGRDANEVMSIVLKSRLQEGAVASRIGFSGFKDKVVVDIGSRDGRFIPLFRDLGAKEVFGVDSDSDALKEAVSNGILDEEHALSARLQDLPDALCARFDIATIFNFNMPLAEQEDFFKQLFEKLPENAQVVMTFAEDDVQYRATRIMEKYFVVRAFDILHVEGDAPHKNLVICTRKPKESVDQESESFDRE